MTVVEALVLVSVLGLAAWALVSLSGATRGDRDWRDRMAELARAKGLVEEEVTRPPGVVAPGETLSWAWLKRAFSRNPATRRPLLPVRFRGRNNGFEFVMDEVRVRKSWTNLFDDYLRMAVAIPAMPATLSIRPAGRIRRLVETLRRSTRPARTGKLVYGLSAGPAAREMESVFLSDYRREALERAQGRSGDVYVHDGKLFMIRRRNARDQVDLQALYDDLSVLARTLGDPS